MEKRPFEGIDVLEFCWAGAGPFSLNFLAYYGATVIKIESPSNPDIVRTTPPYKDGIPGLERSVYFASTHPVKKYDISLNLKHPKAIDVARRLVAWANVIVDGFPAGRMERLGLGYDAIKEIRPDIIMLRSCIYGQTGPLAELSGTGLDLSSLSGFNSVAGWPDRPSAPISSYYTDFICSLFGGLALIAAVDYWRRTGKGQLLDLSQLEASLNFLAPAILDYNVNKRELTRIGNSCSYAAPHGAYRCKGDDRWVAIAVFTDEEWDSFCEVIGNPRWTKDPKFTTLANRIKNSDELDKLVEDWTINFAAEQVMAMMQAKGVSAGVVANAKDQAEDPQLRYYDFFHELDHPVMGRCAFYHPPGFKLSKTPCELGRPPILGEHTEYVCTKILGVTDDEFVQLIQDGVFD